MKYTYLWINFFTIIVPFIFSFHPKLNFHKTWKAFFPAVLITGLVFIMWDIYFTSIGVWGFNEQYLIGAKIANLPVEEVMFFFCIPYACVFTYHCLDIFIKQALGPDLTRMLTLGFIVVFAVTGVLCFDKIYPAVTFIGLSALLALSMFMLKIKWLGKFYVIYGVLLFPFLIVNGTLTGTGLDNPVVWYNELEIVGFRILTIPIEDVFYGMGLILMNLLIYKYILTKVKTSN